VKAALRLLLHLFPAPFRQQFGAAVIEDIETDYDRARAQGRLAALWCAVATAWDLLRSAAAERVSPTWTRTPPAPAGDPIMQRTAHGWMADLRHAMRALRRSPSFTIVTVGTLGLAIGANAAMFGVVDAVLLDPLPYAQVDRLVHIAASAPGSGMPDEFGVAGEFFVQYREQSKLIEDVSTYNSFTNTLRAGDRVERVRMSYPTPSMFTTLGVKPILGRLPVAADENRVVVISHALWTTWYGADPAIIGKPADIGGGPRTIVGVMGPEFKFPDDGTMLWMTGVIRAEDIPTPGRFGMPLVARLKPGVTPEALARELNTLAARLPERFGGSANYARLIGQHRAVVRPLTEQMFGGIASSLWVLLAAAGIVLLVACANVANLFMVRAEGRQRDLAVRRAIGATRGQLIRSQMAESVVMAVFAGVLAVGLAWAGLPVLLRTAPADIPRLGRVHIGATTVAFTLGIALLAAIVCGLVPAIRASSPDLTRLRDGGRGATRGRTWARDGLVVAQTALALVLLVSSGLLLRSFRALRQVDPGYDTQHLFTFQIAPEGPALTDGPSYARFDLEFMDRLRALPGVEAVGLVENVPLNEGTATTRVQTEQMAGDPDGGTVMNYTFEAGDYFKAMGISVLGGRPLETNDHLTNQRNVVVSKSAAQLLWPNKDPIGQRLRRQGLRTWETVVGVVEDVKQDGFRDGPQPLVYFPLVGPEPHAWVISSPAYVVKTRRAETIGPEIRALVRQVAPGAPMYRVFTMAQLAKDSMMQLSFTMLTLGLASALALLLGAVGLYGVLSYVVAHRTREIGVRMALGAQASRVRAMVVAQGARVVGIGIVIGVAAALAFTRLLGSLLFGVTALDAPTFAGVSAFMVATGLLASYLPARRASKVDPIESLRGD
jgi:putative ABC transport system permease protein